MMDNWFDGPEFAGEPSVSGQLPYPVVNGSLQEGTDGEPIRERMIGRAQIRMAPLASDATGEAISRMVHARWLEAATTADHCHVQEARQRAGLPALAEQPPAE